MLLPSSFSHRLHIIHWGDGVLPDGLLAGPTLGAGGPQGEAGVHCLLHWRNLLPRPLLHLPHSVLPLGVCGQALQQVRE